MHQLALGIAIVGGLGMIAIGIRFLLAPDPATRGFGVAVGDVRALTAIKGVRDVTSGLVCLVVLVVAGPVALGWTLMAAALTPVVDAVIVLARGGKASMALGIHGVTAALLIAAGCVLVLS